MKSLLKTIFRYLAEVATSEAGELLSVRRKAHVMEAERYARHAAEAPPPAKVVAASRAAPREQRRPASAARTLKTRNAH